MEILEFESELAEVLSGDCTPQAAARHEAKKLFSASPEIGMRILAGLCEVRDTCVKCTQNQDAVQLPTDYGGSFCKTPDPNDPIARPICMLADKRAFNTALQSLEGEAGPV